MNRDPRRKERTDELRKQRYVRIALATSAIACTMFGWVDRSSAGGGQFDAGDFNYCVSVRFNASAAQLQQIRTAFQNGSQVLADATDGQHQFGTITIVNDSGASQSAEYWVNSGTGRAYATNGRYAVRGSHVNLFFGSNFQQSSGADGDAYTVAHEHVHHAYGVLDEYSGPSGAAECAAVADTAALNYSLMDNYFTRGGRAVGAGYTLNELCVASNHDPDADTYQESVNAESAWETIANHPTRSATLPSGLPVDAPPAAHTVTFRDGIGELRVMLLLDRSGSMQSLQRMDFAKAGAKQFTATLQNGDGIGVASFSSSATLDFSMTEIIGPATITAADTAIDSLSPSGSTNIGGGLQVSLNEITAQTQRSCNEIIVLLSDGDHNTGTSPASVVPSLQSEGVTVMTVGVGTGISTQGQTILQSIATDTSGRFFRVANAADLVGLFTQLANEATGSGLLTRAPILLETDETYEEPSLTEVGAAKATFVLTLQEASDEMELILFTPNGDMIDENEASANPAIDYVSTENSRKFTVNNPSAGLWTLRVDAGNIVNGNAELMAFAQSEGLQLNLAVNQDNVAYPDKITVEATPTYLGQAVVGAWLQAVVQRPNAPDITVPLFDDGNISRGDVTANDGIYATVFNSYSEDGTYTFEVTAMNTSGTTYAGEYLFVDDPSNSAPVPAFVRIAGITAVVSGLPDYVPATVEYGPETINLKSKGKYVTAYIELPDGYDAGDIAVENVAITGVDGSGIDPIYAESQPTAVGDFDNDGVVDRMVKFSRSALQNVLWAGERKIRLEALVDDQPVVGDRTVVVLSPGK